MMRIALGLGLAALAAGAGAAPAAGDPFVGMPELEMEYYDVSGRTVAEIRASLNALRPTDPVRGIRVDGYTRWHLSWWIPRRPDGECRLDQAGITFRVAVGLPRLVDTDRIPPAVLQQWQGYIAALKAHEAIHARYAYEGRKAVLRAFQGSDCAAAFEAAGDARDALESRNDEYDRLTQHGLTEGVRFP
jgi:predicted secreted Zn-dependent protease